MFVVVGILASMNVAVSQEYVLIGWSDLGMHFANKDFSKVAISPPYSTIVAQLVWRPRHHLPQVVTTGYSVEYSIPNNTYSVGKTNFWTYAQHLFDLPQPLQPNMGLTGKGLAGFLDTTGTSFRATGIPMTPFTDSNLVQEKPYQLVHLVARKAGNAKILATTDVVIPVSNEIGCTQSGCHASEDSIVQHHGGVPGFNRGEPVLCATCHASSALGTTGNPDAKPLSYRIHDAHKSIIPENSIETCYKCHPGPITRGFRDAMHADGARPLACQDCHGTMSVVAQSVSEGRRPWLDEPRCGDTRCHSDTHAEQPGKLFRESRGHGGMFCSACHGSPHAILPTKQPNDNVQSTFLQGYEGSLGTCAVCHVTPPIAPGPHGLFRKLQPGSMNKPRPPRLRVHQNPSGSSSMHYELRFDLSRNMQVRLAVLDAHSQVVETLLDSDLPAGTHTAIWDAARFPIGVYYCRLQGGGELLGTTRILLKR
jgi:hypothetical protein